MYPLTTSISDATMITPAGTPFDRNVFIKEKVTIVTYNDVALGHALQRLRKWNGVTALEVAEELEVTESMVNHLEAGRRSWHDERIDAYLAAIDARATSVGSNEPEGER